MPEQGQTQFARNGDVHLAYQTVGSGPIDILLVDTWLHHVEAVWDFPEFARFLRRLSSFGRLIHFDRRATGLSDPVPLDRLPDFQTQMEDVVPVLDAAGSQSTAVFGTADGTLVAMLLAAAHPERCRSLLLFVTFDSPAQAVRCALSAADRITSLGIQIRAGVHTGEVEVRGADLGGLAVHIGARVAAAAQPGQVLVSSTVKDLLAGSSVAFEDRGEQELKGVPGEWRLFAASG
jgi:class 3 adenylate cyclase